MRSHGEERRWRGAPQNTPRLSRRPANTSALPRSIDALGGWGRDSHTPCIPYINGIPTTNVRASQRYTAQQRSDASTHETVDDGISRAWISSTRKCCLTVRSFWKFIFKNWKFSFEEQRTSNAVSRMAKKLEPGLTTAVTSSPLHPLRLACCLPHPPYSAPMEGGTDGGRKAYGLEDVARIHHGDC
jgi:hypothetical protein